MQLMKKNSTRPHYWIVISTRAKLKLIWTPAFPFNFPLLENRDQYLWLPAGLTFDDFRWCSFLLIKTIDSICLCFLRPIYMYFKEFRRTTKWFGISQLLENSCWEYMSAFLFLWNDHYLGNGKKVAVFPHLSTNRTMLKHRLQYFTIVSEHIFY